jgi:hypothetical protein
MSQTLRSVFCLARQNRRHRVSGDQFLTGRSSGVSTREAELSLQHCPDAQTIGAAEFEGGRAELPTMRNRIPGRESAWPVWCRARGAPVRVVVPPSRHPFASAANGFSHWRALTRNRPRLRRQTGR